MKPIPSPRHILVACMDKPADVLLALPVIQTLRSSFPQARITALVEPSGLPMIQGHPAVDAVVGISGDEGLFKRAGRLRAFGADTFLHLDPDPKMVLAAWLAKIPVRVGVQYKWQGFFQTHTVAIRRAVSDRNEVEYNFELLKPLGVTRFAQKIEFPLRDADKAGMRAWLGKRGLGEGTPYLLVHPGSKGRVLAWKAEKYAQLLGYLCQIKGLRVVVTAAPGESSMVSEVTGPLFQLPPEHKPLIVMTEELDLRQLAALCQGALCLLSGPQGPMHLAAAVGTPTVTLFSPAPEATPVRWGAWGNEHTELVPQNPRCPACQVGYCKKHDPMEALSVLEVFEAVKKYIRRAVPV